MSVHDITCVYFAGVYDKDIQVDPSLNPSRWHKNAEVTVNRNYRICNFLYANSCIVGGKL